jgi:hypothetical protein
MGRSYPRLIRHIQASQAADPHAADEDNHSIHLRLVEDALRAMGHRRFPVLPIEYRR